MSKIGRIGYKRNDPWVICDLCGWKKRANETRMQWDGLRVCAEHWEEYPVAFKIPPVKPHELVPINNPRPMPSEIDVDTTGFEELDDFTSTL